MVCFVAITRAFQYLAYFSSDRSRMTCASLLRTSRPRFTLHAQTRRLAITNARPNLCSIVRYSTVPDKKGSNEAHDNILILKQLARYLWPKNKLNFKIRVVTSITLLVTGKLLNVAVPITFKTAIDSLNRIPADPFYTLFGGALIAYGVARFGASLFSELRNAVFSMVRHGE